MTLISCTSATFGTLATSHLPYARRKLAAFRRIMASFFRYPAATILFFRYGVSSRPRTAWKIEQTFSGISMLPRLKVEQAHHASRSEVLLFEQGLVQLLGSLALPGNERSPPNPERLVAQILPGWIDGLIWFENAEAVALDRLRERSHGRSRFDSWSDNEAMKNLRIMRIVLERAVQTAEDVGIPVLRLDPRQPLEINRAQVADWLPKLKQRRPVAAR